MIKNPALRALGLYFGYIFVFRAAYLIALTIITSLYVRSPDALQLVNETIRSNAFITFGFSAAFYITALHFLSPLTKTSWKCVLAWEPFRNLFSTYSVGGILLSAVLLIGTGIGGYLSYLGIYVRFDEVALSIFSIVIFSFNLCMMVYIEEYILRERIEPELKHRVSYRFVPALSGLAFLFIKGLQFDLTWTEALNLFLLNFVLSKITSKERRFPGFGFHASASFLFAFLWLTHLFFGLPFLGQEMPGLILLRPTGDLSLNSDLSTLLAGGVRGPLNGLVLTILLPVYALLPSHLFFYHPKADKIK